MAAWTYTTLTGAFGAVIEPVDLNDPGLDEEFFAFLRDLLFERLVLVFRDQELTPTRLIDVSRRYGRLARCVDSRYALRGYPDIAVVGHLREDSEQQAMFVNAQTEWHYDYAQTD